MKGSVLLVDEDLPHLVALREALEPLGLVSVAAVSGDEALRLILQQDFTIVIMDLKLPDMNGFELCSLIRRRDRCRGLPVLIMTWLEEEDAKVLSGWHAGAFELISKSAQPEILRAKVIAACVAAFQPAP